MNALLFAGQGAQAVGMGRDLAEAYPECKALYTRANEVLGYDLARICWEGPESELVKSNHCQPAIFVTSAVCCLALQKYGAMNDGIMARRKVEPYVGPQLVSGVAVAETDAEAIGIDAGRLPFAIHSTAGLSLGEWAALWLAEAVSFEEALRILEARGRFIQEACEERAGAMLSVIGLEPEKLKAVAVQTGVEIANYNSPEQTVLSGARAGIQVVEKLVKEAGAKRAIMLNVAGAYHSSLMASAAQRLEAFIRDLPIRPPCLPVISNVTGQPHGAPDAIRRQMVLQVTSPVQWVACVQTLQRQGVTRYIECGPGRVLSGLVKRIHPEAELCNVQDGPSLTKTLAVLSA